MIRVRNAWKTYQMGKFKVHAVRGVSLDIKEGEFTFIIGPSGSGKTTLLDMLGALSHPTKGDIHFNGNKLSELTDYELSLFRRRKVGYIFQNFNLIPSLTALENVLVPLMPDGLEDKDTEKGKWLLELVGLGSRINHKPNELSGGERQRVAVARSLVNDPLLILADEPTGNLDSKTGTQIFDYMREICLKQKKTFVIVTHDTEFIKKGDKVFRIKDGEIHKNNHKKAQLS